MPCGSSDVTDRSRMVGSTMQLPPGDISDLFKEVKTAISLQGIDLLHMCHPSPVPRPQGESLMSTILECAGLILWPVRRRVGGGVTGGTSRLFLLRFDGHLRYI